MCLDLLIRFLPSGFRMSHTLVEPSSEKVTKMVLSCITHILEGRGRRGGGKGRRGGGKGEEGRREGGRMVRLRSECGEVVDRGGEHGV